jgi:prepilin-type N-terminal cleavage/methylation domain-containing protein
MRKARGFTLIEIAIVLVIIGMIIALFAAVTTTLLSSQRRQATASRLAAVDAALVQFVVQNQRLPCPADGTLDASTQPTAGTETAIDANGCVSQTGGVVPWRALGLGEQDATDGWGRRITYRVWNNLTLLNAMNMASCDPAGTKGTPGAPGYVCDTGCIAGNMGSCTSPTLFLSGDGAAPKGFTIKNVAGTALMAAPATGAAYVLISAGETGGGAYTSAGQLAPTTTTDGTEEQKNYANLATQPYYVDDQISDGAGATHFDDVVLRPSVLTVASRAGLGPRAH